MTFTEKLAAFQQPGVINGTYDLPPCRSCGCQVVFLDPTPHCPRCERAVEDFALLHEQAYSALSQMVDMVPALPVNRRSQAHDDSMILLERACRVWLNTETRP